MPYQVTRSDTGQFVLMDTATDTVVIDDDLAAGFAKLETIRGEAPAATEGGAKTAAGPAEVSARRFLPTSLATLLALVLPFVWFVGLYFALANLLAEQAVERKQVQELQQQIEALQRELQAPRRETPRGESPPPRPIPAAPPPKPTAPDSETGEPAPEDGTGDGSVMETGEEAVE